MILKKRFKENSHQPIETIKQQQYKRKRDIVQPRIDGEVNPEYVNYHGAKGLNISNRDVERMNKIDHRLGEKLSQRRREQKGYF